MSDYQLITIKETQDLVQQVVKTVREAVVSTMGPNGTLSLIGVGTSKKVTKDGVTVARSLKFNDPRMEMINKVITEAAIKTDEECGDGTTTTILLTSELYEVFKRFPGFADQRYIEEVVNKVVEHLEDLAIRIDSSSELLYRLALTSSNNDEELSRLVCDIYKASPGRFPEIELKEGIGNADKVERVSGLPLAMTFSNPQFSLRGQGEDSVYEGGFSAYVIDDNLRYGDEAIAGIEMLASKVENKNVPIFIIARSLDHEVNVLLRRAATVYKLNMIGIQTNMGGSVGTLLMQDLAMVLNAKFLTSIRDLADTENHYNPLPIKIGSQRSLLLEVDAVTQDNIDQRIGSIRQDLETTEASARFSVRSRFNEKRIRNLQVELVTVYVGGETISEIKERIDRFEDVVKAVRSALANGILPGVGTSLITAYSELLSELGYGVNDNQELTPILAALLGVFVAQYRYLTNVESIEENNLEVTNLATGKTGTATELGIYDTAYASITALKGGLQTAKILANLRTILLGDKLAAVSIQQ